LDFTGEVKVKDKESGTLQTFLFLNQILPVQDYEEDLFKLKRS
jgi:hypothetical protein